MAVEEHRRKALLAQWERQLPAEPVPVAWLGRQVQDEEHLRKALLGQLEHQMQTEEQCRQALLARLMQQLL